jgi:hypothetical protein
VWRWRIGGIRARLRRGRRAREVRPPSSISEVGPNVEFGLGGSPGGMGERGGGRLADMEQNRGDGIGVGQERDERERRRTGGADEGKDFLDPSQEGGPGEGARGVVEGPANSPPSP